MDYITEIFERANLQHIREFLLNGTECVEVSGESYKQRIDSARKPVVDKIHGKFPGEEESEEIMDEVFCYSGVNQEVYMEIGMQCGAALLLQLLANGGSL